MNKTYELMTVRERRMVIRCFQLVGLFFVALFSLGLHENREVVAEIEDERPAKARGKGLESESRGAAKGMPGGLLRSKVEGMRVLVEGDSGKEGANNDWELRERPTEKLADVAGLDELKRELREKVIEPYLHPELFERFKIKQGGGVLMYGPPGKFKRREMAWLRVGVVKIELFSKREDESLQQWNDFASGPVHMAFLVPNLDAFLSEALAKGARFHPSHPAPFVPPVEGASKIAYLLGPDGEEVELRDSNDVV